MRFDPIRMHGCHAIGESFDCLHRAGRLLCAERREHCRQMPESDRNIGMHAALYQRKLQFLSGRIFGAFLTIAAALVSARLILASLPVIRCRAANESVTGIAPQSLETVRLVCAPSRAYLGNRLFLQAVGVFLVLRFHRVFGYLQADDGVPVGVPHIVPCLFDCRADDPQNTVARESFLAFETVGQYSDTVYLVELQRIGRCTLLLSEGTIGRCDLLFRYLHFRFATSTAIWQYLRGLDSRSVTVAGLSRQRCTELSIYVSEHKWIPSKWLTHLSRAP